MRTRSQTGFSLVELLVVVLAIMLTISALAIPDYMRSRIAAKQGAAVATLHHIHSAQIRYTSAYPLHPNRRRDAGRVGRHLLRAPTAAAACLIDEFLAQATASSNARHGCNFHLTAPARMGEGCDLNPNPLRPGTSGANWFYRDASGLSASVPPQPPPCDHPMAEVRAEY